LGPFAAGNRSKLIRPHGGKEIEIKLKLEALVEHGDMTQNLTLLPGDVLVVPQSLF
jgi:polysaccharide export outer membrane protein